jgi:hypothetical protein
MISQSDGLMTTTITMMPFGDVHPVPAIQRKAGRGESGAQALNRPPSETTAGQPTCSQPSPSLRQLATGESAIDGLQASSFAPQLIRFNDQRISERPGVFPGPGDLPADALSRASAADGEPIPD